MRHCLPTVLVFGIAFFAAGLNWAAEPDPDKTRELDAEDQALLRTLRTDKDPGKRRNAVLTLAERLCYQGVGPLFIDTILNDKDESVRATSIDVMLAREANPAEVPLAVWITALHDKSARVRARAAVAVECMVGWYEEGESPYWTKEPELVKAEKTDNDPVVRGLIALAVGKKSADRKAALPLLLAALKQEDASPVPEGIWGGSVFEPGVMKYIGDIGPDAKWVVPVLVNRLAKMKSPGSNDLRADGDARSVVATVGALVQIGPAAVPKLVAQLKSEHGTSRTVAAMALVEMGQERAKVIPVLIQSLHGECGGICVYSHILRFDVTALGRCGHEAVPSLLEASKNEKIGKLSCEALCLMKDDADAVVPQLIKALSDQDSTIRRTAATVLGRFGQEAERAIPVLLRATKDVDDDVGRRATASLASIYLCKINSDDDLVLLADLTKLEELYLANKNITGPGLIHLSGLRNLRCLTLPRTITDVGLKHLHGLTNLKHLNLSCPKVTDAGLKSLQGLTNLEQLDLDDTQITDTGLQYLSGMKTLESLNLRKTSRITDAGLAHLRGLTKLKALNVWGTQVTDAGLIHLAGMKDLDRLILTDHITNAGLSRLEGFTKLAYLNLAKSKVTEEKVRKLEKTLPKCKIWYYDRDSAKLK